MLNATVVGRTDITPELFLLRVKPDAPIPAFRSGQYVALGLLGGAPRPANLPEDKEPLAPEKLIKRAYSIGSTPEDSSFLEFYIAVVPDGALTPRLSLLKQGDRVYLAPKITGTFTLEHVPPGNNLVLLSTGTGLAPFISMIRTAGTWTPGRKITIIHGVRFSKDLAYRDELLAAAAKNPNLVYHAIVSRTDPEWTGATGRVQKLFADGTVAIDPDRDNVFLCGNPAMIEEMETLLAGKGYTTHSKKNPNGKMHVEKYW